MAEAALMSAVRAVRQLCDLAVIVWAFVVMMADLRCLSVGYVNSQDNQDLAAHGLDPASSPPLPLWLVGRHRRRRFFALLP